MTTNAPSYPMINPSLTTPLLPINRGRPRLRVNLKQFCSYLFEIFIKYETALTIKQFQQTENQLYTKYSVESFATFQFDDNDNDDNDVNLVSFLDNHRMLIDPNRELSVYGYNVPKANRQELYEFVNQLVESNSGMQHVSPQDEQLNKDTDDEDIKISDDNLLILEKAVIHKFGGLLGFQSGTNILRKARQPHIKGAYSIIR
jgi:hypothetical protein